jgi:hypothetical protein
MPIACFLVEKVNERTTQRPCDVEGCGCGGYTDETWDWRRVDTGEILAMSEFGGARRILPPGAMWWSDMTEKRRPTGPSDRTDFTEEELQLARDSFAKHGPSYSHGPDPEDPSLPARYPSHTFADGPHLLVMTPGGPWNIDSRASNCAEPFDYEHRSWIRTGEPPNVTVGKGGRTCAAGAGSIQCGDYHGFLQAGSLT